ncbi:hypothetical protein TRFO_32732 [Tritrichomonas foetus]|uniref:USP domain-containing protein n=1 Tax=Tritrichomonas foetus TaxID=1144522 RepID=A0A1J4JSY8_9EUKA|nr:hypothetical protein TRFO_32732 [Tritrichomonas foetus]|eukprot:OHT00612.1 hypothetical protein TRFO_32732 [Tritrichomonas foetus]
MHDGTSQLRLQDSLFQFIPDDINHKKRRQKCYIYCIAITLVNLPLCQHYFYEILNCIEDSINMKQLSNSPFYNLLKSFNFHPKDNNDDFLMFIQKYINSDEYNAELDDHDPINVLHNMIGQLQKTILDNHIDIDSNRLNHLFTIKWQFNNTEHSHYMITLSSNEITESSIMNSLKEMMNISSDDIQTDLTILEAYILTIQCFGNNFETIPFEFFMNNVQYKLITVIVHIGSCQSFNHFVTLFLHDDGYWWISDDDHFERIHEDEYDQYRYNNF